MKDRFYIYLIWVILTVAFIASIFTPKCIIFGITNFLYAVMNILIAIILAPAIIEEHKIVKEYKK